MAPRGLSDECCAGAEASWIGDTVRAAGATAGPASFEVETVNHAGVGDNGCSGFRLRLSRVGVAASHGRSLDGIDVFEIQTGMNEEDLDTDESYDVFHPSEVELGAVMRTLHAGAWRDPVGAGAAAFRAQAPPAERGEAAGGSSTTDITPSRWRRGGVVVFTAPWHRPSGRCSPRATKGGHSQAKEALPKGLQCGQSDPTMCPLRSPGTAQTSWRDARKA
jgi:hypothetical protein